MKSSDKLTMIIEGILFAVLAFLISLVFVTPVGDTGIILVLGVTLVIFYSFRRGLVPGLLSGALLGILTAIDTVNMTENLVLFVVIIIASTLLGLAGLFARNLQRTLHNRRMSSVYLNLVTGSLVSLVGYFAVRILSQKLIVDPSVAWGVVLKDNAINFGINAVVILIILIIILNISSKFFIPRNTPFISRKERSRLLND